VTLKDSVGLSYMFSNGDDDVDLDIVTGWYVSQYSRLLCGQCNVVL
jgi:hypothetical protein